MGENVYMPVKIDPEVKAQLRVEAARLGLSMSELVRRMIQVGWSQYMKSL